MIYLSSTISYRLQMYFMAKDELITIVPNFSLPTENGTAQCIGVGCGWPSGCVIGDV